MLSFDGKSGVRALGASVAFTLALSACTEQTALLDSAQGTGGAIVVGRGGMAPVGTGGMVIPEGTGGMVVPAGTGGVSEFGTGGAAVTGGAMVTGGTLATGGSMLTGGATVTGGTAETGGAVISDAPPCVDNNTDVAIIGDSYVDWGTHTFVPDLHAESGKTWPSYALGGTSIASGGLTGLIPPQFDTAIRINPDLVAVVMDGGGNDVLLPDAFQFPQGSQCKESADSPNIADCQKIVKLAIEASKTLMDKMAGAGVKDTIYFYYPHIPGGGAIGGANPNVILDYALPMAKEACDGAAVRTDGKLRCHFVDMVPEFAGQTGLFGDAFSEAGDGVHPNSKGSKVMAAAVWRMMQDKCVGQPSSSGCCTP